MGTKIIKRLRYIFLGYIKYCYNWSKKANFIMLFYNGNEIYFNSLKNNRNIFENVEMLNFETEQEIKLKEVVRFNNDFYTIYNKHIIYKKDRKEFQYYAFTNKYLINLYSIAKQVQLVKGMSISSLLKMLLNVNIIDKSNAKLLFDDEVILTLNQPLKPLIEHILTSHGLVLISKKSNLILENLKESSTINKPIEFYDELEIIDNIIENNSFVVGNSYYPNHDTFYNFGSKNADYNYTFNSNYRIDKSALKAFNKNLEDRFKMDKRELLISLEFDETYLELNRIVNINLTEVSNRFKLVGYEIEIKKDKFDFDLMFKSA